jgi:hypothetical protein
MSGQLPDLGLRMFIPKKHLDTDELPLSDFQPRIQVWKRDGM